MEILWDLPKQEVLQILEEFHKKSLIVKKYNATLKCNVYGIHDLLLYHLKNKMLDKEALEVCNNYFSSNIFKDTSQPYFQPFFLELKIVQGSKLTGTVITPNMEYLLHSFLF